MSANSAVSKSNVSTKTGCVVNKLHIINDIV